MGNGSLTKLNEWKRSWGHWGIQWIGTQNITPSYPYTILILIKYMQRGFRSTQIPGGSSISKSLDQAFNRCVFFYKSLCHTVTKDNMNYANRTHVPQDRLGYLFRKVIQKRSFKGRYWSRWCYNVRQSIPIRDYTRYKWWVKVIA